MRIRNRMMLLFLFLALHIVHGQLSIDELFSFHSKYTSTGDCNDFQYEFPSFQIQKKTYNQLIFDCNSSSLIWRNTDNIPSAICPEDETYFDTFRIHIHKFSKTLIEVNQFRLHGIELCSLDDLIQSNYTELSYYRSTWALLINLKSESDHKQQHHLAIATNGEMTFLLSSESSGTDIVFASENSFRLTRPFMNIWRIDQGYVRYPESEDKSIPTQLSKTNFSLFNDETFFIYYSPESRYRRLTVYVDQTPAKCRLDQVLQCQFPVLPLTMTDAHQPIIKLLEGRISVFNSTVSLIPHLRLNSVSTSHNIKELETYVISIDENLCNDNSLRSRFNFTAHLQTEDVNGTQGYRRLENPGPIITNCNVTLKLGREVASLIAPVKMTDILSLDVDLTHQWFNHEQCRAERTRINFIKRLND